MVRYEVQYHFTKSNPMQKSCNLLVSIFLCVFMLCSPMENVNIHETMNGQNRNSSRLSPESLIDCCLVWKVLVNKPMSLTALKVWLASFWQPERESLLDPLMTRRSCVNFTTCVIWKLFVKEAHGCSTT